MKAGIKCIYHNTMSFFSDFIKGKYAYGLVYFGLHAVQIICEVCRRASKKGIICSIIV